MIPPIRWLFRLLCASTLAVCATARDYRLTIPAAEVARAGQVISFRLPQDAPRSARLTSDAGQPVPLQVDEDGEARFVIPHQPAGQSAVYRLGRGRSAGRRVGLETRYDGSRLYVSTQQRLLFMYWAGERPLPSPDVDPVYLRSGFIHPVRSPAGVVVTDSYPVDHRHHHGIWSPWTKTKFQGREPDFWNMAQKRGKVEAVELVRHWGGPVQAGFVARHDFIDQTAPEPIVALHETWEVNAYVTDALNRSANVFDLVITQTCATNDPLILPEYHYGGLGYRGHGQWNGRTNARFLTSEGLTDRVQAHATRARWCHVGGEVDGKFAGTAILGHPQNFRAPQPMRIHPNEPFFCFAPSQLGDWQIEPGQPYVARYRFVVMDGEPDQALLEAYWAGYAEPGTAVIEPL